ncbi:major facilitator superfamily domain-containing protein [Mycena metata]|uniref:Major facilitator superfamily domain-containing protein n=1 Tax=Mycena metata TaxID=1033252 RepID=A0AAD7I1V4_9AGAR|nr:major facilitator superfamily domain-containing protein [Mycena metata]
MASTEDTQKTTELAPEAGDFPQSNVGYPDGAWRAWSTVAGTFIVQFYVVGVITAFGVFQDFYTRTWLSNCSASTISWIGGVTYFFELGCAPVGGKLYDAGFGRSSVWFGSFLSMLSFFLLSLAKPHQYYQVLLSQGVGMGIGLMLVFGPSMTMVSEHFNGRRGLAMGIVAAASPVGSIVFTIVLNHLFHSPTGFTWGMRYMGFMSLGCFVIGNALIFTPRKTKDRATGTSSATAPPAPIWDLPYILILISGFLWALGANTPNFYMQLYAGTKNLDQTLVFDSFAILCVGSIFGRIIPGWMADRWGAANIFIPSLFALGCMCFAMLGIGTAGGLVIFALLYGYLFGTIISIYLPMIRDLSPDGTNMGRRMGYALSPIGIGMTVGPPMIGAILSSRFIWWRAIVCSGIIVLSAACFNVAARQIHVSRSAVAR